MQVPDKMSAFEGVGIPVKQWRDKLPVMCEAMTTTGRHIGFQSEDNPTPRPVMATNMDGRVMKASFTVGSNRFVVGMNPQGSKLAPPACASREVSDRIMERLYSYPLTCPGRRLADVTKKELIERKAPAVAKAKNSHFGRFSMG
ncbi:hypothetical protein GCG54_00008207 [Colletotrichum gloeosporioides]|uniref:Uncharacterized protein n=1 Tax=Colletotrichum gloeosporioides TaxID=474922 RepID=A0A8H4FDW8_COLGL|nr:uncharacterized protein GCG54_00008207 [Colletotrichum gloeosporioides]KAF3798752.1 hypothetical protein GCG54_00008207 [Colletotrichum gloeosporioides]